MADVCLILEGTYPYVYGGVASWTHALIQGLPHLTFEILYLGSRSDQRTEMKYELPANVSGLREVFLFDELAESQASYDLKSSVDDLAAFEEFQSLIQGRGGRRGELDPLTDIFQSPEDLPMPPFHKKDLLKIKNWVSSSAGKEILNKLQSQAVWEVIVREYERISPTKQGLPFLDFFYSWRAIEVPLLRLMSLSFPYAKVYHTMCTGYAGFCGVLAAMQHQSPLMVTEHGIYAHERAIELGEAGWLYDPGALLALPFEPLKHFRSWWINVFRNLSALTYAGSSRVVTLHGANRRRQLFDGADPARCSVIPNGVHARYHGLRARKPTWPVKREQGQAFEILFLGRIVSIKDVKLLIKAVKILVDAQSGKNPVICRIVGPFDEEKEYAQECQEMSRFLGLDHVIKFEGRVPAAQVLETADCLVLTSISESQPLVILEASSSGVPVVATDVGACREMVMGQTEADRMLGLSGLIVPIGDALAVAQAMQRLMDEPELWNECSQAGTLRASNFYHEGELFDQYNRLYNELSCGVDSTGHNQEGLPWQE